MNRKIACVVWALAFALLCLVGCSGDEGRTVPSSQQSVGDVLQEQTEGAESEAPSQGEFVGDDGSAYDQVDYDLTGMNSDMVYATVYDMMVYPENYEGKIVRMEGPYYHTFSEETGTIYHYIIIQDAMACCSQGLEFVWGDGSHVYPNEFPEDGSNVIATGKFEAYTEDGMKYVRLADASLEAASP